MDLEKGEKSVPLPGTDDPGMYEPTGSPLHESPSRSSGVSASTVPDHGGPPRPDDVDGADASRTISHEQQFIRASRTLSRIDSALTSASQRHSRVLSTLRSRDPAQDRPFHHPLEYQKTGESVIVDFDGPDDPYRPMNWPFKKKCITTMLFSLNTLCATWASSVYSPAVGKVAEEFHVGQEVATLGVSLLLFGFATGPLVFAPLSELFGRKLAILSPVFIAAIFSIATAVAKDIQTVMISRFFTGFFSAAPITSTGGVMGDIWPPRVRAAAIVCYAMGVVGGPTIGPIVGGAIESSYLGWRWTEYITGIMTFLFCSLGIIFLDETYPPRLLVLKARRLRFETGNWALHARHEEWDVSINEIVNKYLIVPFALLGTPICALIATYASFVYGILYLQLSFVPIAFREIRGWGPVTGELPFLSMLLGILIGAVANVGNQKFYIYRLEANDNKPVPEARLLPMMCGSVMFAIGFFIFGWTSFAHVHWITTCIGLVCIGFGFFTIFQSALNYLIDTFPTVAASAIAANTFLRSAFSGAFPLFSTQMAHGMGLPWACSLLGFVSIAMIPIPFLFYFFGRRIRAHGKWSRPSL